MFPSVLRLRARTDLRGQFMPFHGVGGYVHYAHHLARAQTPPTCPKLASVVWIPAEYHRALVVHPTVTDSRHLSTPHVCSSCTRCLNGSSVRESRISSSSVGRNMSRLHAEEREDLLLPVRASTTGSDGCALEAYSSWLPWIRKRTRIMILPTQSKKTAISFAHNI